MDRVFDIKGLCQRRKNGKTDAFNLTTLLKTYPFNLKK